MKQKFTSKDTSINKNRVPALFKKVSFFGVKTNYDCGGGKYDTATDYLLTIGIINHIVDKYNRTKEWNKKHDVVCDSATCSNVLNVIAEKEIRKEIIIECYNHCKMFTAFYIYEGNKSNKGKKTKKDCWQNNFTTDKYLDEILDIFGNATMKGNLIIAYK